MTVFINVVVTILAIAVNGIIAVSLVSLLNLYFRFNLDFLLPHLSVFGVKEIPQDYISLIITSAIMTGLVILSMTPAADYLLRPLYGFRKPLTDEVGKLNTLVRAVCLDAGKAPETLKVYIVDEQFPNAYALGLGSIGVTRRLLKNFPDNEIKGVIAHEIGHLNYKDSLYSKIFMTVSIIGQVSLIIYHTIANVLSSFARIPIPFLNLFVLLISWAFRWQVWLFELLLVVPLSFGKMFGSRQCEYRADKYACQIGHGEGLYSFLYRILDMNNNSSGFLSILRATHPPTAERIRKIDKMKAEGSLLNAGISTVNT